MIDVMLVPPGGGGGVGSKLNFKIGHKLGGRRIPPGKLVDFLKQRKEPVLGRKRLCSAWSQDTDVVVDGQPILIELKKMKAHPEAQTNHQELQRPKDRSA
jgi:hypothetical protein